MSRIEVGAKETLRGSPAREASGASGTPRGEQKPKSRRVSHNRELAAVALGAVSLAAGLGGLLASGPPPGATTGVAATGGEAGAVVPAEGPFGDSVTKGSP